MKNPVLRTLIILVSHFFFSHKMFHLFLIIIIIIKFIMLFYMSKYCQAIDRLLMHHRHHIGIINPKADLCV